VRLPGVERGRVEAVVSLLLVGVHPHDLHDDDDDAQVLLIREDRVVDGSARWHAAAAVSLDRSLA